MTGAASASALSGASPEITTSWRAPLEPSIMVTVFCSPGAACFVTDFAPCSETVAGAVAGFSATGVVWRSAMRATGSPPSGSSLKMTKPAKVTRNRPSSTASAWVPVNGSRYRRFRRTVSCPSGVLRSSAVSTMDLPESTGADDTTAGQGRGRYAAAAASQRHDSGPSSKKGDPKAALFAEAVQLGLKSVRRLVGSFVARTLVGGGRRGGIDLDAVEQIGRHLQGLVVLGVRRHVGLRTGLFVALGFQMAAQRGFALGVGARLQLVGNVLQYFDIGNNAFGLDRFARWREVARGGETQRAVAGAERDDGLHRALAERAGADQRRTLVVLQRAGDDFGGRCRAAVDENDQLLALGQIARMGGAPLGFLGVAATGRDDLATLEEGVGNGHRFFQQAAGIVAQVDDIAFQLVADLRRQVADFPLQAFGGLLIERGDADIADIIAFHARAHRADADVVAHQRDFDRVVLTLANDLQPDLGVDGPTHFLDGLIEGEALHGFVVKIGDDVVGHDAGLGRRRVIDRRDDLDQSVFHRDFDAEPAEFD